MIVSYILMFLLCLYSCYVDNNENKIKNINDMKNLNVLSKLCSPIVDAQSSDVGYDSRATVGSPSGNNYSTLLKLMFVLVLILTIGSGNAWGAAPTLSDLSFSTESSVRIVNENFNGLSTTDQHATKTAGSTLSGFGAFDKVYNGNTNNHYAIESSTFGSNALKITMGATNNCGVAISGKTYGTTGAWRARITKASKMYIGIASIGATADPYTKASGSVYIQNNDGTIKISKNTTSGNWQNVGSYTSNTYIDICVIYNNTTSPATYGNSISLAAKTAHVYIDGTCVMNGENPKAFTLSGIALSYFRVYAMNTSGYVACVDDVQVWNALPGAAGTKVELTKAGQTNGTFTMTQSSTPVTEVTTTSAAQAVTITATPYAGYYLSNLTATNPTTGTATVTGSGNTRTVTYSKGANGSSTITATFSCLTPTISVQPAASTSCLVGASPELSVTAAAGGASLSYQWKQCATVDGTYVNVASGGTSSTYSPSTASAGTTYYKCVITNAASGCSTTVTSDPAEVTVNAGSTWKFKYSGDSYTEHTMTEDAGVASYSISLAADTRFNFCIDDNGTAYKNNGTIITTTSGWVFNTTDGNCNIHTGPAGTYTFAINTTTKAVTVTYPDVTHPNDHYVYFKNSDVWGTVYGYLYNTGNDNKAANWPGSVMAATTTICGETYHYAALNAMSGTYNSIKFNDGGSGYGHETSALSTTSSLGKFNANRDANWHAFKYTISFNGNGNTSGSMSDINNICIGSNQALTSNAFAKTYYTFAGWHADVDVKVGESTISAGDMISNGVTIKDIQSNIALEAQWSVIPVTALTLNYSTLKKYVGESSVTLSVASVTPGTANPAVTWTSSDATVASVDGGVVSFLKAGTATITATSTISGGVTATCSVEVRSISSPTMQDEDGTTISGSGLSANWTLNTRTLAASEGTSKYKFKRWVVTNATPASTTNLSTTLGDPTGNVTVVAEFYKPRTVTKGTGTGTSTFTVSPTGEVKYGSSVTVTCAATDGYKNPWTLTVTPSDGATYSSSGSDGSITISNITKNITVDLAYTDKGCTTHAGTTVQTATGTSNTYGPLHPWYNYSMRQILYTRSDLNLAAGKKGTIKSISFDYQYGSSAISNKNTVKIYMANTTLTALAANSYVPFEDFTEVYSGALNFSSVGYKEFELSTDFEYNGAGNLVVLIFDNSGVNAGSSPVFNIHTTSTTNTMLYKNSDSSLGTPSSADWSLFTPVASRPNTKFCIEESDMVEATVNWHVNGSIEHSQTDYEGTALTSIPTPDSEDCDGEKEFVGWYTDDYTHATVAPAFVNPKVIPAGGADYYAVFATVTPTNNYQQITSEGDLVAGAKYLIVGNSSTTYNALPVDAATSLSSVSPSGTPLTISNPGATLIWTLEGSADAWKIKSTNNNKYLQISSGSLTFETSTSLTFSVGVSSNIFTFTSSAASGNKILSYYHKNTCFNAFTGPNNVYVFKQVVNATNYATTCAETYDVARAGTPAGTVTGGTFTVSPSKQAAGKTVTLSATPDLGYAFGSWTVTKTESPYTDITSTNVAGNTLTMPAYGVTVNATFTPTPTLTATGGDLSSTTLPFGTSCEQDEGTDKTFVLNGYSLTNNVTLTIGGTDASMFSVKSPSSPIDKGTGRINDQTVTVTFTPTSTGVKTATLTIASSGASSIVLTLSGTAIKHYKVHYWNSGTDVHQESVLAGADASATWDGVGDNDGCDTETFKYFVGWSKTNVGSTPTTTKPTIGETYTNVSADVNYYAVWTNVNPNGWERYESSTIAEGDYLFIQYYGSNYQALNNSISSNRMGANVATLSGGLITQPTQAVSYDWNDYIWHIAKPDPDKEEYTIYNADESKYIVSTGTASQVDFVASPSDGKELFTITYNSTTKKYVWTNKYNSTNSVNAVFRYGGSGFACYASTDHNLYLYYRAGGTAQYITNCCDKNVTLATNSPSHGSITFSPSGTIATCGADAATRQTTMTVTPDAGYYLSAWSTTGVTPYSVNPSIAYGSVSNSGAQATTVTFNQNTTTGTYTANATFTAIPVSSLSLRAQQTGQSDKVGNDLTMNCYPKEGQTGGNDPLNHTLKVLFEEVLPANALDKTYDWSVRVKATGDADWTAVGFTGNALNTNSIIHTYNKSTGTLIIKATEGTAEIKITAHDGSGVNAKVTITVANVAMSSVSVSPTEMEVYAGQKKPVTVTFTPANATDRSYSAGSSYTYVNIQNKGASSFNIEGKTSVTDANHDETVTVTTTDGSKTATVDVTVKPLPKVMFVDNVHNKSFANVIATVDEGGLTVTTTKPTPTLSDVSDPGASYNTCERQHLHLLGWIESTWADAHPNAEPGDITGAGAGNYYAAGADIDLVTQNNKTFYAVWTKIE